MDAAAIDDTIAALRRNRFDVRFAENRDSAREIFFGEIIPEVRPETVSWGDSMTMRACGIVDGLDRIPGVAVIRTFDPSYDARQKLYWRRQAMLCDMFVTGSNAVTRRGQIVNLDMIGNRAGAIVFGPSFVTLFIGANKIVEDLDAAFRRVREVAAPLNAAQHAHLKTPCSKTGKCMDCSSPDRICNSWTVIEKCHPAGRIKVILIGEELGL